MRKLLTHRLPTALALAATLAACGGAGDDPDSDTGPAVAPPFAGEPSTVTPGIQRPGSVVLIMVDALRADQLGAYGSDRNLTPNLDRLAERSAVFEQATATSSWTRSSIASMFTGRYPVSHTVLDRDDVMPPGMMTLAEALETHGDPWSFGIFTNPNSSADIGFDQGFDHYSRPMNAERRRYEGDPFGLYPAEAVTDTALDLWDDERRGADQPAFAFVHYMDPHDPYMPNPGVLEGPEPDGRFSGSRKDIDELVDLPASERTPEDEARQWYLYRGEVGYADREIGRLIEGFRERGVYDDMLLVVTSDHGESFFEHGKRGHGQTMYQSLLHVPLMIKLPGMQPGDGMRVDRPVSLADLAPTVLDVAGIERPRDMEGRSLLPLVLDGDRDPALDYVYSELYLIERYIITSIRHGDYKLIANYHRDGEGEYQTTELELYNLAEDPDEQDDLAGDDAHREKLNRLVAALMQWEEAVAQRSPGASTGSLEDMRPETLEALRGLGYIE